jgi:hypothetical protein
MMYHIFIGSTPDDLKNERKELPRIVMELGHIPVMADYLDDSAKTTPKVLQKIIGDCDYFIALVAHKFDANGHHPDGCNSPLAAEYSIAVQNNVPVLGLIIDEKARWKAAKKETNPALVSTLDDFKAKLRSGPCATWLNTPDLCQKTQALLIQQMCVNPRPGKVRGDSVIYPAVANEIARLSRENAALRPKIDFAGGGISGRLRDDMKQTLKVLALNKVPLSFYYTSGDNWENTRQFRFIRIFKLLVPELAMGKTTAAISRFLGTVLNPDLDKAVRKDYPTPSNTVKKIMTDFSVLKLVKCTNPEGTTDDEIWEITEYGHELYAAYRLRQLEKNLKPKE